MCSRLFRPTLPKHITVHLISHISGELAIWWYAFHPVQAWTRNCGWIIFICLVTGVTGLHCAGDGDSPGGAIQAGM